MAIGIIRTGLSKEALYTLDTILSSIGFLYHFVEEPKNEALIINYGDYLRWLEGYVKDGGAVLNIYPSLDKFANLKVCPTTPNFLYPGKIPFFFGYKPISDGKPLYTIDQKYPVISQLAKGKGYIINVGVDPICETFFFISRIEELQNAVRDEFGRFPTNSMFVHKKDLTKRLIVHEHLNLLSNLITHIYRLTHKPLLKKDEWPNGKRYACALTHDVDFMRRWRFKSTIKGIFTGKATEALASFLRFKKDRWWNFDTILEIEGKRGVKSTFFFMPCSPNYKLNKQLLIKLESEGYEIGLHSTSPSDVKLLSKERTMLETVLGREVSGVRQHYLKIDIPTTYRIIDELKFSYDTTLGFTDLVGFRASFSLPYHPYDPYGSQSFSFLELPLTIMDSALFTEVAPPKAKQVIKELIETIKRHKGLLITLWHQRVFNKQEFPLWGDIYKYVLDNISDAWVTRCQDVAEWWLKRESLRMDESTKDLYVCYSNRDIERLYFSVIGKVKSIAADGTTISSCKETEGGALFILSNIPKGKIAIKLTQF